MLFYGFLFNCELILIINCYTTKKISETDKNEIIQFTKIKAQKNNYIQSQIEKNPPQADSLFLIHYYFLFSAIIALALSTILG